MQADVRESGQRNNDENESWRAPATCMRAGRRTGGAAFGLRAALIATLALGTWTACEVPDDTGADEDLLGAAPTLEATLASEQEVVSSDKAVRSVPAIDTTNRAAVVSAYNTYFQVAMPALGFTGSASSCAPGAISLEFQEWTISRINFLRAMAGVSGNTTLNSTVNAQQQAAALIMAASEKLTHTPDATWSCFTDAGRVGANQSNLSLGLIDALPQWMTDPGPLNTGAGHRRWILDSRKQNFGLGQAVSRTGTPTSALYAVQRGPVVSVPNGIAWPPRGYVPLALFPAPFSSSEGQRWSFGLTGTPDFSLATVTVTRDGQPIAVSVDSRAEGFGDMSIVWKLPAGHVVTKNSTYHVTIAGIRGAVATSYAYDILPIDPSEVVPPPVVADTTFRSPIAVTHQPDGRLDMFGIGADKTMQHKAWAATTQNHFDGVWTSLGGAFTSPPSAVSWGAGRVDVFARGPGNNMYHKALNGNVWTPAGTAWDNLGGVFNSPPSVVSWGPNRLDVFGLGTDNALYRRSLTGSTWSAGWERLGGNLSSPASVVSWGANRLDVFAIGADKSMQHRAWTGTVWGAWENLGGVFSSPPSAVAWGPNRLDVFGLGTNKNLYQKSWTGSAWAPAASGWTKLGNTTYEGAPEVVSNGTNTLDVFAVGTDKAMYHGAFANGAWGGFENLGGVLLAPPAVAPDRGQLHVFGLGTDRAMYQKIWSWSASASAGGPTTIRWIWFPSQTGWNRVGGQFSL